MEKLHKKADIIAALKREKGKDPCLNSTICHPTTCALCTKFICIPAKLNRRRRKDLVEYLTNIKHPVPFKSVITARNTIIIGIIKTKKPQK